MKKIIKQWKENQQGFSLLSVLVAISFIGIMAMLAIYISSVNFKMRMTQIKGTEQFYLTEQALEEIKAGLQEEVGEALSSAYIRVLENYNITDETSADGLDMQRQKQFKSYYIETLSEALQGEYNYYDIGKLSSYVDIVSTMDMTKEQLSVGYSNEPIMEVVPSEKVVLKNLKITHINEKGYASILETDICMKVPEVAFPTPSTLPDLMNMIVVANNGVTCTGGLAGTNTNIQIKGNLYAGDHISIDPYTNVIFSEGERVVSLGKVSLSSNSSVTIEEETALWAEGIDVSSSALTLKGNTYIADDLTIQKGNGIGSVVKLSGEYYGFGSKESAESSYFKQVGLKYNDSSVSKQNSSIIVNGKNTTLDLSGLRRFMVSGNSYIGNPRKTIDGVEGAVTGESLAIKGTQIAYLVPASVIGDGSKTNPMTYKDYSSLLVGGSLPLQWDTPIKEWDNKTLNEIGLNKTNPYTTIMNPAGNGEGFVYVYLNFETAKDASNFFKWYYEGNETRKAQMDQYMKFYLSEEGIVMNDPDAFLRFITSGNVLTYSDGKGNVIESPTNAQSQDVLYEQINFQNTWYSLTRKMIPNFDMLNDREKKKENQVFENLVNEDVFDEMTNNTNHGMEFYSTDLEENPTKAIVVKQSNEFVINEEIAKTLRLLVCNGNVRIEKGVSFQGIIMTKGTLTIEDGATLTSNPSEAARLLQAQTEDKTLAMVFYNGDQYVIGNSGGNSEFDGNSNQYELEKYIIYENWNKQ